MLVKSIPNIHKNTKRTTICENGIVIRIKSKKLISEIKLTLSSKQILKLYCKYSNIMHSINSKRIYIVKTHVKLFYFI